MLQNLCFWVTPILLLHFNSVITEVRKSHEPLLKLIPAKLLQYKTARLIFIWHMLPSYIFFALRCWATRSWERAWVQGRHSFVIPVLSLISQMEKKHILKILYVERGEVNLFLGFKTWLVSSREYYKQKYCYWGSWHLTFYWNATAFHFILKATSAFNGKQESGKSPHLWVTEYLSFSWRITSPFFQEESALGEALGLQSKLTSLPTCTWINFFIGVFEKSGAEAEKEERMWIWYLISFL